MPDSIPAIVDKDLFEEVQLKSRRTAVLLPATRPRMIILLTTSCSVECAAR